MVMQRYAEVENGAVVNVVVFDPEPKENWIRSDSAAIGDVWDGEKFRRPAPVEVSAPSPEATAADILSALIKKGVITEADLKGN